MKLTKQSLSRSFALTAGILWVLCSGIVALLPGFSRSVTQWWLHGMVLSAYDITLGSFLLGGATVVASGWFVGYIFGWSLQLFSNEGKS